MEKIITLPVNGGAGTISPINRFQEDIENLMDAAADILLDDLLTDALEDSVSVENWERYAKIVRSIFAASNTGWDLPMVKDQAQPLISQDCASITITIPKNSPIPNEGRTALAMATLLADEITTSTDKGKAQICFTVRDIHYAAPSFWD